MQKRTIYLSLLLASFLLVFAYSFATAQSVTIQSKSVNRCSDVILDITVNNPSDISAFEVILALDGSYSNLTVNFDDDLLVLTDRVLQIFGSPDTIRMAAMRIDAGDACLPMGNTVVGQIHLKTGDVCPIGAITISGATVSGTTSCDCSVSASTGFVGCNPIAAIAAPVTPGTLTFVNQLPSITCPGDTTIHWGDVLEFDFTAADGDITNGCENLTFAVKSGPFTSLTKKNATTGHYVWATDGEDVCDHTVVLEVTDDCGAKAECSFDICVENDPPVITYDPADTIFAVWDIELTGQVDGDDLDGGPSALLYELVSFDGPTYYGTGFELLALTGVWTWNIGYGDDYTGDYTLCVSVTDGANLCTPCSPTNADTACYKIHVTGFTVSIEKVHNQLQGHYASASIYLDSNFTDPGELLGGFDFLIAYDASALAFQGALPGALIDNGAFEYFTYRMGPFGNCGSGCPSGLLRVVGMRESNNGVINPNHVHGPGELVILNFYVSNDRTFECQYAPIRFFWLDCGDNIIADESGNWSYLGIQVWDFEGGLITDPVYFGYNGPDTSCFDTVYTKDSTFKNAPLGSIIFRNGGIDIVCADSIDARGDVNLNGIANEIGDAVVFTNYFIAGLGAFTINDEGQIAATEVNGDGIVLSVADLVYLIRVIVGDVQPLPKLAPGTMAEFYSDGKVVRVKTPVDIGAALFVFEGEVYPTVGNASSSMEIKYAHVDGTTRALVYSMERGHAITNGEVLNLSGQGNLISVEAATYEGAILETNKNFQLPTAYALNQNYPNPFNPVTTIELALPVASDWTVTIYNVSGQVVTEYTGHSEAGIVTVNWDASNLASGMYLYKATAGSFSATKKMVLLK